MSFVLLLAPLLAAAPQGACALLDAKVIARVQGHAPASTRASERSEDALTAQQCFFALPDVIQSVSLEVTRPAPAAGTRALRARWERIAGEKEANERAGAHREEDEGSRPARRIRGVGRAALWAGSQRAGALYVLGPSAIVRVSVGGAATEDEKIRRSIQLAKSVLARLKK